MKQLFYFLSLLFPIILSAQIKVADVGDGWANSVNSSLMMIKSIDTNCWATLNQYCTEVGYWNGTYSTTDGKSIIYISTREVRNGDLENIAAVLVHEALHLLIANQGIKLTAAAEEKMCYEYELQFLIKLGAKPMLISHAQKMIEYYSE
jgi:hypothetical protein